MPLLPKIMPGEWGQVDRNFSKITKFYIGPDATPTYTGLTLSGLTQGSAIFAGASGIISEDNSNLFWDNTNKRLGIGTNTPDSIFHIKANTPGTVGSHPAGQLIIQDPDDTVFGNAVITGYESDGAGNPDQQLWYLGSSSSSNSEIIFLNRRNSKLHLGTNGIVRMTIESGAGSGNVGIGTTSPKTKLTIEGALTLKEQAAADGDTAAYGQVWCKDDVPNTLWFVNDLGTEIRIAPQDLQTSASPTFTGLTLSGITQGSVFFAGASGVLSQDNTNLFWDDTINRLGVGVNSGFDSRIGLTISGDMDILHTAIDTDDHAFELDINAAGYGDIKAIDIVYVSGAIGAGEDEEAILVNVDESDSGPGNIAALEVLTTAVGSAKIFGLEVGINVIPIEQLSGTFGNMAKAENDGVNALTEFTTSDSGGANNIEIFVANSDTVLIGNTAKFEEIEFIFETFSNPSVKPTFEFSTGGTSFSPFTPADGTNGMRNNGVVLWLDSDIPSWATNTGGNYEVRITRTKGGNLASTPKEDLIQIGTATEYVWDKDGNVNINSLTLATVVAEGTDIDKFLVSSSGVVKYRTGTQVLSDIGGAASGHNHSGVYEPADSGLTSLAALTYVSDSFIKVTAEDTYAIRTIAETADDLEATIDHDNLANGGAHDYAYITGNDGATDVSAAELEELSDGSATVLHSHAGVGAHTILDGSTHSDSVADAVTRGSLIYGNATPKWDELVIGGAGTILSSDGTDAAWTAPIGKVKIDAAATADYLGAAFNDGALRTGVGLSYTDGGNFVTLDVADIGAAVYHDAVQAIGTASLTALAFNQERWDTDTIHDNATNNTRLTCKTAGKYLITGDFSFAGNATGFRQGLIRFEGTTTIAVSGFTAPAAVYEPRINLSTIYILAVNEYVELCAYQDSGGNLNVQQAGNYTPEFRMQRIA